MSLVTDYAGFEMINIETVFIVYRTCKLMAYRYKTYRLADIYRHESYKLADMGPKPII